MKKFDWLGFFQKGLLFSTVFLALGNSAFAQVNAIGGTGASNLMAYVQFFVNFCWWTSLAGCFLSVLTAGFIFSQGDQHGFNKLKAAIIGTLIVAGASGFFKYFVFGAQSSGVSNQNDLF
jgi:hypothetical protein